MPTYQHVERDERVITPLGSPEDERLAADCDWTVIDPVDPPVLRAPVIRPEEIE